MEDVYYYLEGDFDKAANVYIVQFLEQKPWQSAAASAQTHAYIVV